jgi:hypothetical protein
MMSGWLRARVFLRSLCIIIRWLVWESVLAAFSDEHGDGSFMIAGSFGHYLAVSARDHEMRPRWRVNGYAAAWGMFN